MRVNLRRCLIHNNYVCPPQHRPGQCHELPFAPAQGSLADRHIEEVSRGMVQNVHHMTSLYNFHAFLQSILI